MFERLIEAVKCGSLGRISHALYAVGVSEEHVTSDSPTVPQRWGAGRHGIESTPSQLLR